MAVRDLDEVIQGAEFCKKGNLCSHRCPYWNKKTNRCGGDWQKDLIYWAKTLQRIRKEDTSADVPQC